MLLRERERESKRFRGFYQQFTNFMEPRRRQVDDWLLLATFAKIRDNSNSISGKLFRCLPAVEQFRYDLNEEARF